jgi:hypothetical protein
VNPKPNIGPVHQGFGSGSEQVRTSKNRKFFSLDLEVKTVKKCKLFIKSIQGGDNTLCRILSGTEMLVPVRTFQQLKSLKHVGSEPVPMRSSSK